MRASQRPFRVRNADEFDKISRVSNMNSVKWAEWAKVNWSVWERQPFKPETWLQDHPVNSATRMDRILYALSGAKHARESTSFECLSLERSRWMGQRTTTEGGGGGIWVNAGSEGVVWPGRAQILVTEHERGESIYTRWRQIAVSRRSISFPFVAVNISLVSNGCRPPEGAAQETQTDEEAEWEGIGWWWGWAPAVMAMVVVFGIKWTKKQSCFSFHRLYSDLTWTGKCVPREWQSGRFQSHPQQRNQSPTGVVLWKEYEFWSEHRWR